MNLRTNCIRIYPPQYCDECDPGYDEDDKFHIYKIDKFTVSLDDLKHQLYINPTMTCQELLKELNNGRCLYEK